MIVKINATSTSIVKINALPEVAPSISCYRRSIAKGAFLDAVVILISLAATLAFLVGLVSVIVPLRFLRVKNRKQALGLLAMSFVLALVGGAIRSSGDKGTPSASTASTGATVPVAESKPAAAAPPVAQVPAAPAMPADEAKFVAAIVEAQAAFRSAPNEMAQGGTRASRRQAICSVLRAPQVKEWTGTISTLSTSNDGKGVLAVSIAKDITVSTWNNTLSDTFDKTLIEPGSPIFNAAVQLKKGDRVAFSGAFLPHNDDCMREKSMTLRGSMTDPDFAFRFSSIRKL